MAQPNIILTVGFNQTSISQAISRANSQLQRGLNANAFTQPLGRITGKANEFQKSLEASNARVIAFGASAGAIYALRTAFNQLVKSTIDVERSLTEINVLLNLSSGDLAKFSTDLFRVANATGTSFADASKAAQEFSRQGLGVVETLKRTQSALTLTRLSGLALTDSVSSLTAALNSFGKEALTDIEIVNRLANVDAKFAVSAADLAEALKRVASSAADAGVEFNQVIALVTAAQQATARGGAVIGNSFKTIFTRLQRPQVIEDLEAAGVAVRKANGDLLPLIQILRNLSTTYDSLSSGQRSFVAETVGGVYQINILKSVLNDLGSGFSTFENALIAAGESTSIAQKRLAELNETLSAKIQITFNNLTKVMAGVGSSLFEPVIRGSLGAADKVLEALNGISADKAGLGAGLAKGLGNALAGPGIQFAVFAIIKLFQRLQKFVIDSFKDLTGINARVKERAAIEEVVLEHLKREQNLVNNLLTGNTQLVAVHDQILQRIRDESNQLRAMAALAPAIADALQASGVRIGANPTSRNTAGGYIPNLNISQQEIMGAAKGGYRSGPVLATSISDGSRSVPVIANGAETRSSVKVGGKTYDFINPPASSMAGKAHARRAKAKTGMNPYELGQSSLFASGFVPNLSIEASENYIESSRLLKVAQEVLNGAHPGDGEIFAKIWGEKIRPPSYKLTESKKTILGIFRSLDFNRRYVGEDRKITNRGNTLAEMIVNVFGRADKMTSKTKTADIDPTDIQKMLNLRGPEFAALVAFKDFGSKSGLGAGDMLGETEIDGVKFTVPFKYTGLKNPQAFYELFKKQGINSVQEMEKAMFGETGQIDEISNEAQVFGNFIDTILKSRAERFGIKTGKGNENLDLLGYDDRILEGFEATAPFAGADVKTSMGPDTSGQIATKIARALTLKKGAGAAEVPAFKQIKPFKGKAAGVLDYDLFDGGRNEFEALIYAAVATGKPFRTNIGPMGSGKTTNALAFGGGAVKSRADLDSFEEFVLNTAAKTNLTSGILGLALSSSSEIVGFNASKDRVLKNLELRAESPSLGDKREQGALSSMAKVAKEDPTKLDYQNVFDILKGKFGALGRFKFANSGMVPHGIGLGEQRFRQISEFLKGMGQGKQAVKLTKSDYEDAIAYLEGEGLGQLNKDIKHGGFTGAFPFGRKRENSIGRLLKKKGFKFTSGGLIPSLNMAVQDAMGRENEATGGYAQLGSSPKLVTNQNPLGLAAIDKRSQRSADEAITQHLKLGQSMGDIKRQASGGHVPNLAVDNSNQVFLSAILAMSQALGDFGSITNSFRDLRGAIASLGGSFGSLTASSLRSVAAQRTWMDSIERAKVTFLSGRAPATGIDLPVTSNTSRTRNFRSATEVDNFFRHGLQSAGRTVKDFDDALAAQKRNIQKVGFATSIGGGIVGGTVSQMFSQSSPDLAAGIDQFTSGLTTGGQVLSVFQNTFGKVVAGFSVINGAIGGLGTFVKGIESARKNFEVQQSQSQKLIAGFDALSVSLATLDSITLDSSVGIETLNKEFRKYQETLAKISALEGGRDIANRIQTAPDNKTKINELNAAKALENKRLDLSAGLLSIKELGAERTAFGLPGESAISGGIFGFKTASEKEKGTQILQGSASTVISDLKDAQKDVLFEVINDREKFQAGLGQSDVANKFISEIRSSGGTENDVKLLVEQIRLFLGNEKINKDPNVAAARRVALENNDRAQVGVDSAVRNELAFKKLFLNQGSLQGSNILDQRRIDSRERLNQGAIAESRDRAESGTFNLLFGELTNQTREIGIEIRRGLNDRQQKLDNVGSQSSRALLDSFTQSFDSIVPTRDTGGAGEQGISSIPEFRKDFLEALNKGLSATVKGGDLTRFIGKQGDFDFESFEKSVISNSGATGGNVLKELKTQLTSNRGTVEILKIIQSTNNEVVEINQESLKEQKIQSEKLEGVRKELETRRQSNFLGGTRALTDRNFRRETTRQFIRGARLLETGQSQETRGRGAAQLLDAISKFGLNPLKIARRNAETGKLEGVDGSRESQLTAKALNVVEASTRSIQGNMEKRINASLSRLGGGGAAGGLIRAQFNSQSRGDAAGIATLATFRPEGDDTIKGVLNSLSASSSQVDGAFSEATAQVVLFSRSLEGVRQKLDQATSGRISSQNEQKRVRAVGSASVNEAAKIADQGLTGPKSQEDVDKLKNESRNKSSLVSGGIGLATVAAIALLTRGRTKGIIGGAVQKGKNVVNRFRPSQKVNLQTTLAKLEVDKRSNVEKSYFKDTEIERLEAAEQRAEAARQKVSGQARIDAAARSGGAPVSGIVLTDRGGVKSTSKFGPKPKIDKTAGGFKQKGPTKFTKTYGPKTGAVSPRFGASLGASSIAGIALNTAGSFLPSQEENDILRGTAGAAAFIPGGQTAFLGVKAGEAINDIFVGRNERKGAAAEAAYGAQMQNNPIVEKLLELQGSQKKYASLGGDYSISQKGGFFRQIGSLFGASPVTSENFKGRGLSEGAAATRDKVVAEYNRQASFLKSNSSLNRLSREELAPLFDELAKRIDAIRQGKDVSSEINVNLEDSGGDSGFQETSNAVVPIKIEISIKDADQIPEILNSRLIKPLEQQLKGLQSRAYNIEQRVGIEPQPAEV